MAVSSEPGYVVVTVKNMTHLYFEYRSMKRIDEVLDRFYIVEVQNIGVLEPMPIPHKSHESRQESHTFIILLAMALLLVALAAVIYFIRKKWQSRMRSKLINYEMEKL